MRRYKNLPVIPQPKPDPIPVTQATLVAKQIELERLKKLRAEVMERLVIAREMGDLSENGAYHAAKFELGNIGRQLRAVKHIVQNGYVPQTSNSPTASFGQTVTLINQETGKRQAYTLVTQFESDLKAGKLSLESPLGTAILGKKVGQVVTLVLPTGTQFFEIESINPI